MNAREIIDASTDSTVKLVWLLKARRGTLVLPDAELNAIRLHNEKDENLCFWGRVIVRTENFAEIQLAYPDGMEIGEPIKIHHVRGPYWMEDDYDPNAFDYEEEDYAIWHVLFDQSKAKVSSLLSQ